MTTFRLGERLRGLREELLKPPDLLSAEIAKTYGYDIPAGWHLRLAETGEISRLIDPTGWEYSDLIFGEAGDIAEFMATSPLGVTYTKAELAVEQATYEAKQAEWERALAAITQFETPEGLYDVAAAREAGVPEEYLTLLFPEAPITEPLVGVSLDQYLEDLFAEGLTDRARATLREMGLEEEDIESLFAYVSEPSVIREIPNLFFKALPDIGRPEDFDAIWDYYSTHPSDLRNAIIARGRNPDTEALVTAIYPDITERGIDDYFRGEIARVARTEEVETGIKNILSRYSHREFKSEDLDVLFDPNVTGKATEVWMRKYISPRYNYTLIVNQLMNVLRGAEIPTEITPELPREEREKNYESAVRNIHSEILKKYPEVEADKWGHPKWTQADTDKAWYKEWRQRLTEAHEELMGYPFLTYEEKIEVFKVFGQSLLKVPRQLGAAILQAIQGQGGASVVDKDWADRFIENAQTDIDKFTREVGEKYAESDFPISMTDVASLPQNIAFSLTSMGAGLAVGVPVALVTRVGAYALGTAASGVVAYSMTTYQIMQQYLELMDGEKRAETGQGLTLEEETQLKQEFASKAHRYGLWEAIPEAISNLSFALILTVPLTKVVGENIALKIIAKLTALYGEEFLTETITQKGQSAIEVEAGLREGRITWWEAFKEVAPQTFLLTTILGGIGQVSVSAVNRIKASLKTEIGEEHPLYKTLDEGITEEIIPTAEAPVAPEVTPAVPGVAPAVPEAPSAIELRVLHTHPARVEGLRNVSEADTRDYLNRLKELASEEAPNEVSNMNEAIRAFNEGDLGAAGVAADTTLSKIHKLYKISHPEFDLAKPPAVEPVTPAIEKFLATPDEQIIRPSSEVVDALKARGFSSDYIQTKMSIPEMKQALRQPIPRAVPEVPPVAPEAAIPKAEVGMPEAGLQPSMLEAVPAREVRPEAKAEVVQARLDDYLKLQKYKEAEIANRIDEINKLLATKGRLPKGMGTRAEVSLELARLEAQKEVAEITTAGQLQDAISEAENELGLRSMPYHGGVKETLFPDKTTKQLDEMLKVYEEARAAITPEYAKKPQPALPEPTAEEVATNLATTGEPTLTPAQIERTLALFGKYVTEPSTQSAWELTRELRRETLAGRAQNLKARTQELIVDKGMSAEEALNQARRETMSGELPALRTDYTTDLTQKMRDVLFDKVYQTLKAEPFEMMSTAQALTNALLGKPIPRVPGVKGGSAFSRLQRVFGEQPEVMKAIEQGATQGKELQEVFESIFRDVVEGGRPPILIDQKTAEYLRGLSANIVYEPTVFIEPIPVTKFEAPIEDASNQVPLWPTPTRDMIVKVLKEIGWSPIDIGNFLRANKASFDMSFWRQQGPLIANHPVSFVQANIEAWKALWSQKSSDASWERITRDPLYQIYEVAEARGYDFLRPLELAKGTSQWRGVEEFGYITGERLIPRLTGKIPHVKLSSRAFVTGTNEHNWRIFNNHYEAMLKIQEKVASGEITLKPGEAFSIEKEMMDMARMLADFTQRASLGKVSGLASALNSLIFAPRATLGRLLTPRHLVSANPHIRMEAWRNLMLWVGTIGGVVLLGYYLGLWEVERDPRSAEFMSIRIGNIRVDLFSGYRQFLVFFTRVFTGTGVSSVTGAEYETDPMRAMTSFIRGKAAPLASIILDFWIGRNFVGEEVDVANKKQWAERIAPFAIWDIYEAYIEDPTRAAMIALPAIVGAGVQTYTGDWAENWPKLGLPKYSDNLDYGETEPVYDAQDFWADTAGQFTGVDPATLTPSKGYPPYIKAIAEALEIREQISDILNQKPISLNADPSKGTTFGQYYQMWLDREKIVATGDEEALKEFDADERTRNAHLGNMTQRQYAALVKYHTLSDEAKEEFLEDHPELTVNPRTEWLKSHPKENAQLAIWGQAKILTLAAYNEAQKLIKELDIPDDAIPEFTLPPEGSVESYFDYLEQGEELGYNSWEVQLIVAKDDELRLFLDREPIETPVRALELKIKHRELSDEYDGYGDRDSPLYIEDDVARDEARDKLKADNPEWVDDMRRIEAIELNASDEVIDSWVERGHIVDEFTAGSSEAKVWLLDNPEVHQWALDNNLLTDDGSDWNEPVLRINAEWREQDEAYDALETREERDAYLEANSDYAIARIQRSGYELGLTDVTKWTEYNQLPMYGAWRDRYKISNPDFFKEVTDRQKAKGIDTWDTPEDVRAEPYDTIYEQYKDLFDEYAQADAEGKKRIFAQNPVFKEAYYRRQAYELLFPEQFIENYTAYYLLPAAGYAQERYLKENREFYKTIYKIKGWKEPIDFDKVPSVEVEALYNQYLDLPTGNVRLNFRYEHQDLDEWMLLTGKVTRPATEMVELTAADRRALDLARESEELEARLRELEERLRG